jgi:hypothetical protein
MARLLRRKRGTLKDVYETARSAIASAILSEKPPTKEVDLSKRYLLSTRLLGDYVTLDWKHCQDILKILRTIRDYAEDRTRRRPLNIIMRAEPGSGKSHLVQCIAGKLDSQHASAVNFNMASLQSIEDLVQPLDAVRNLKVIDSLPILFLDEFDSDSGKYPLLLPLMWDGELHIGHRDLKLGKLVIVLAGSGQKIETTMKTAKGMQPTPPVEDSKLVDLLSRINGGELEIPPLDVVDKSRDNRIDKACLTISLLQRRFGNSLSLIPWCLLRFVVKSKFRYGVRSIAHLIDLVSPPDDGSDSLLLKHVALPLNSVEQLRESSLAYHVFSEDGPAAIVDQWKTGLNEVLVRVKEKEELEPLFL